MRPAILVVHGDDEIVVSRVRALARRHMDDRDGMVELAITDAQDFDAAVLEPMAREIRAETRVCVVHLVHEGCLDSGVEQALDRVNAGLLETFPAMQLEQWCVVRVGRDLDRAEALALERLTARGTACRLRGVLIIATSTDAAVANDEIDEQGYTVNAVYSLLTTPILHEGLPAVSAMSTMSVAYRPDDVALAQSSGIAASVIRDTALAEPVAGETHRASGLTTVDELRVDDVVERLLAARRQGLAWTMPELAQIPLREQPEAVLAAYEDRAFDAFPQAVREIEAEADQQRGMWTSKCHAELVAYLRQQRGTRPCWLWLHGLRDGLEARARSLAERADLVEVPTLDAAMRAAELAVRRVPPAPALVLPAIAGAGVLMAAASAAIAPATLAIAPAAALATSLIILSVAAGGALRAIARRRVDDLQRLASRRLGTLLERAAILTVRDRLVSLVSVIGDVEGALDDAAGRAAPGRAAETLADDLAGLHAETIEALGALEGLAARGADNELRGSRFNLLLPIPPAAEGTFTSQPQVRAVAAARGAVSELLETWDLDWDCERIVDKARRAAAPSLRSAMPASLAGALGDADSLSSSIRELLSTRNAPRLRQHDQALGETDVTCWVFRHHAHAGAWWLPEIGSPKEVDDEDYVSVMYLLSVSPEMVAGPGGQQGGEPA